MPDRWEQRIDKMDTSKGVSNKMIQQAMLGEIKDLRALVKRQEAALKKSKDMTHDQVYAAAYAKGQESKAYELIKAKATITDLRHRITKYQNTIADIINGRKSL